LRQKETLQAPSFPGIYPFVRPAPLQNEALRLVSNAMVSGSDDSDGVTRKRQNGHLCGQPALLSY
jgi:hypothetical protein